MSIATVTRTAYPSLACLTMKGVSVQISDHGIDVQVGTMLPTDAERIAALRSVIAALPGIDWRWTAQVYKYAESSTEGNVKATGTIDGLIWKVWSPLQVVDVSLLPEVLAA